MTRPQRQQTFPFRTRGGARPGAGRPPNGARAGVSHLRRPAHSWSHPLHVTLKVKRGVPSLRGHALFVAVRRSLAAAKHRFGFSLVHFSVQRDHLHLIAEANDRRALSRGVQGLSIRVARAVNRSLERTGRLFADRYHARALKTPREVRFALRYVLLNARKHARPRPEGERGRSRPATNGAISTSLNAAQRRRAPQGSAGALAQRRAALAQRRPAPSSVPRAGLRAEVPAGFVDTRSSAPWFRHFARPAELAFGARQARAEWERRSGSTDPPVVAPRVWLLLAAERAGWFDVDDVPGGGAV